MSTGQEPESPQQRVIRQRNRAMALILGGLVVLFFVITLVKFHP